MRSSASIRVVPSGLCSTWQTCSARAADWASGVASSRPAVATRKAERTRSRRSFMAIPHGSFVLPDDTAGRGRQDGGTVAQMWRLRFSTQGIEIERFPEMSSVPFEIKGLDHIVLRVRDLDRMVRFYCDVLGCRMERVQAEIGLTQVR